MDQKTVQAVLLIVLCHGCFEVETCPSPCNCSGSSGRLEVNCENRGLKAVPENLPSSMYSLNLKGNRNIRVPPNVFQNKSINRLFLNDVGLNGSFLLPRGIETLLLGQNKLTELHLQEILFHKVHSLISLYLNVNNMLLARNTTIFHNTPNLVVIDLSTNTIPIIGNQMFRGLGNLNFLHLSNCATKRIDDHAFHDLIKLKTVDLSINQLRYLPTDLLNRSAQISHLNFANNRLQRFTTMSQKLSLTYLDLSGNRLRDVEEICTINAVSLDLRNNTIQRIPSVFARKMPKMFSLDLSWNNITEVGPQAFSKSHFLKVINLSKNKIHYIHRDAFIKLTNIHAIYLSLNRLSHVPSGLLRGLSIKDILLDGNNIASLDGVFSQLSGYPNVVTIFKNKIREVTDGLVQGLGPNTTLYLDCSNLVRLGASRNASCNIICASFGQIELQKISSSIARSYKFQGFECNNTKALLWTSCRSCKAGSYNDGQDVCQCCPVGGYYQGQVGQGSCKHCNNGQFVNHSCGASRMSCKTCPPGTDPNRFADTRACYCLPHFWRFNRFDRCFRCNEKGLICKHGSRELAKGYWWYWLSDARKKKYLGFRQNLRTSGKQYVNLYSSFYEELPNHYRCPIAKACLGGIDSKCHQNYTGPLCAVCNHGYYRTQLGCLKCKSLAASIIKLLSIPCILVFLALLVTWADKRMCNVAENRSFSDVIFSVAKIFLGHWQLLAVIIRLLSAISWPRIIVQLSISFYQVVLEVMSFPTLKCIHPSLEITAYAEMLATVIATFLIPLVITFLLCVHVCVIRRNAQIGCCNRVRTLKGLYLRYILLFLFVTYPFMCQRIFQVLPMACHTICYDKSRHVCATFLHADYRVQCASSDSSKWIVVKIAYASCILPVGVPALLFLLLRYSKRKLSEEVHGQPELDVVCYGTRFCYESYTPSCWYWEILDMLRKLLFTVGFAFFGLKARTTLGLMIIISGLFAVAYAYKKPIKYTVEHFLQLISLLSLFFTLCIGVLLHVVQSKITTIYGQKQDKIGITITLLVTNGSLVLFVLFKVICFIVKKLVTKIKEVIGFW